MKKIGRMLLAAWCVSSAACGAADLRQVASPHYAIWTDLPDDAAREAALRMTRMADEYARRTADFGAAVPPVMPFYLYAHDADFFALGAPPDTAGYFDGKNLVARAQHVDDRTWHTVQHEGFHQFAAAAIHANLPTWLNEGLAEYFGEAVFTGDSFVSGVIPQWRLKRIRQTFASNGFVGAATILAMPLAEWNGKLSVANYDQAWSMVQFLAHGDGGKYQPMLAAFIRDLSHGDDPPVAWSRAFGNVDAFENRWKAYWTGLGDEPTLDRFAQAEAMTFAGFVGRSALRKQRFDSFDAFLNAAESDKISTPDDDWLPPTLLASARLRLATFQQLGCRFELQGTAVRCHLPGGETISALSTVRNGHLAAVTAQTSQTRQR